MYFFQIFSNMQSVFENNEFRRRDKWKTSKKIRTCFRMDFDHVGNFPEYDRSVFVRSLRICKQIWKIRTGRKVIRKKLFCENLFTTPSYWPNSGVTFFWHISVKSFFANNFFSNLNFFKSECRFWEIWQIRSCHTQENFLHGRNPSEKHVRAFSLVFHLSLLRNPLFSKTDCIFEKIWKNYI